MISQPTPTEIKNARETVGDTQAEAAARVHSPSYRAWQDWESGRRAMPPASWELYLIKSGLKDEPPKIKSELEQLDFYERKLAGKVAKLSASDGAAFLADLLGRNWGDTYLRLEMLHPTLTATKKRV